jgi:hypothetical protein
MRLLVNNNSMAIIVKHLRTDNEYIFLGIQQGISKASVSPKLLDLFTTETDKIQQIAVCDPEGKIFWFPAQELIVIEVDGQNPAEMLPEIINPIPLEMPPNPEESSTEDNGEEWI